MLLTLALNVFRKDFGIDLITSCLLVGIVAVTVSFIALRYLDETYGKDLDYVEMN